MTSRISQLSFRGSIDHPNVSGFFSRRTDLTKDTSGHRREAERAVLGAVSAAVVALLLLLALPALASAHHGPATSPQNTGSVTGLVEAGGGVNVPGTGTSPGVPDPNNPRITQLYQKELQGFPGQANSDQLNREATRLRSRVKVLPGLRALGRFTLGGAAGVVAWTVGETVITALFPPKSPLETGNGFVVTDVRYVEKGDVLLSLSTHYTDTACSNFGDSSCRAIAPDDGWRVEHLGDARFQPATAPGGEPSACNWPAKGLPAGAQEIHAKTSVPDGGTCTGHTVRQVAYFIPGGIYPGTPTSPTDTLSTGWWSNQPTSSAQLQQRVEDELEGGEYPALNDWLAHQLEPERFPDPAVTESKEDHRCDRQPGPTYQNPDGNGDPGPFAKYLEQPFTVATRPPGSEGTAVFLRYGTTHWIPGRHPETQPRYIDDWGGWGYRKIKAKHGWSEQDRTETNAALLQPQSPTPTQGGWRYEKVVVTPGAGGVSCQRVVVVDFETGDGDPAPRGIVTSYNEVVP